MKNKTTAGLLAIFLGGLGFHRFYLGQTGLGILYLVFCWTFIPAIVALIDGIIFLTQSEDAFNQKYNEGKEMVVVQPSQASIKADTNLKSVDDFIKSFDINAFNPNEFNYLGITTNSAGGEVKKYRKVFQKREAGLFDSVDVNHIGQSISYVFGNGKIDKSDIVPIEKIINALYYLYGKDDIGKGLMTKDEKQEIIRGTNIFFSRSYVESHFPKPVLLNVDNDGCSLTIWVKQ